MKLPPFLRFAASAGILACVQIVSLGAAHGENPTLLTFDDLSPGDVPPGYGGLEWVSFTVWDGTARYGNEGNFRKNVATGGSIISPRPFTLESAYLAQLFRDGPAINIKGFLGTNLIYETSIGPVNSTNPFLFTGWADLGVTRVAFSSPFVIDNVVVGLNAEVRPKAAPPPGRYSGLLQVTKKVNDVVVSTIVRANASISLEGFLTVLLATPQSPTPQDLQPYNDDVEYKKGPSDVFRARFTDTSDLILIGLPRERDDGSLHLRENEFKYVLDYPAQVSVNGTGFRLSYADPALGALLGPPAEQRVTQFVYRFRRTGD